MEKQNGHTEASDDPSEKTPIKAKAMAEGGVVSD
jgi:hypothetical protein